MPTVQPRIRSKICGFTRPEDAAAAAALGVDAVGLVFYPGSKRCVTPEEAAQIAAALPPFVSAVGLFVNAEAAEVEKVLQEVPLDILQFHGDETAEFCRRFQRPYIKAVRVREQEDILAAARSHPCARALLLDAYRADGYGGTGHSFDWRLLPETLPLPWILSGGLNTDNLADALRQTGAQAIDLSSGAESAPGIKSAEKMAALLKICAGHDVPSGA